MIPQCLVELAQLAREFGKRAMVIYMKHKNTFTGIMVAVLGVFCFMNVADLWLIISYTGTDSAIYYSLIFTIIFYILTFLFLVGLVFWRVKYHKHDTLTDEGAE